MNKTIDYYFTPQSPWSYLGHARLCGLAQAFRADVRVMPVDFAKIFPASGGQPLAKRAPQRQVYRLLELARFRDALQLPLNLKPRYFPVADAAAARLIVAVEQQDGASDALRIMGAIFEAVWAQERDIADPHTLMQLLAQCKLPAERLAQSHREAIGRRIDANTEAAIDAGVFGAPTYVIDGELFWGQDRLDFVERKLRNA